MSKISVVIATQNRIKFLTLCIAGLVNQTISNFEVVVINSGDAKLGKNLPIFVNLKDKVGEKSLTIINSPKKLLAAKAWNTGIKKSSGNIISFLDDDAVPEKNWLQEVYAYFNAHPSVAAANGKIESVSLKFASERIRQAYYDFRHSAYSSGIFDQTNKIQYRLKAYEKSLTDWLSLANCSFQKKFLNKNLSFDEGLLQNAGDKLGHALMSSGLPVTYNPRMVVKHHHYRKLIFILKTKSRSGRNFCIIDKEFNISYKKRQSEIFEYILFIIRNKSLRLSDKILELILTAALCLSYGFQKISN